MSSHPDTTRHARPSRLVRYGAIAYAGLVVYASLYPFTSWRDLAASPFVFLLEPWPRHYSPADVVVNIAGYLPLGFLFTLAALAWTRIQGAVALATFAGTLLSVGMEALQSYLPQRVPSNLDVLSNGLGALLGALIVAAAGERFLLSGRLHRLRQRLFLPGGAVDAGFVMLALWLFTQFHPATWLFGNGDLRFWLQGMSNLAYSPGTYRWVEAGVTGLNLAGVGLFVSSLARPGRSVAGPTLLLIAAAVALKSVAAAGLFKPGDSSMWLTPGAMIGVPFGVVLYALLAGLSRMRQAAMAAVLILLGAALVNIAPQNPYIVRSAMIFAMGHFLSFNGTTRLVSGLWPFAAAAYLCWFAATVTARARAVEVKGTEPAAANRITEGRAS